MIEHDEIKAAEREVELNRLKVEEAVNHIDGRIQNIATTLNKVISFAKEAERMSKQYPYVNLAIFLSAGFLLGRFFDNENQDTYATNEQPTNAPIEVA